MEFGIFGAGIRDGGCYMVRGGMFGRRFALRPLSFQEAKVRKYSFIIGEHHSDSAKANSGVTAIVLSPLVSVRYFINPGIKILLMIASITLSQTNTGASFILIVERSERAACLNNYTSGYCQCRSGWMDEDIYFLRERLVGSFTLEKSRSLGRNI